MAAYKYRDMIKRHYNLRQFWVTIKIEVRKYFRIKIRIFNHFYNYISFQDLASFDDELANKLYKTHRVHRHV